MRSYPVQPGVPAAGHVTASGFWHPGSSTNCQKGQCQPPHDHRWVDVVDKRAAQTEGNPAYVKACRCGFYYRNGRVTWR